MKKICVITSTRADYGILKPLIARLDSNSEFQLSIVATGMHLSSEFGKTYHEIEVDGFIIDKKIDILLSADSPSGVSKTMGMALIGFADFFEDAQPDLLIILGDRYEIAAVCCAAINARIPIAHIHGGETTEGAIDECYRHSITKMSSLHFVSCEPYRRRVIQLGEHPDTVFNVGALSVENIKNEKLLSIAELSQSLNSSVVNKPYAVVTFHPVTIEDNTGAAQVRELMMAIDEFSNMNFIVTKSNSDAGGREINKLWDEYATDRENILCVTSLGMKKYLSALKYAKMVIGNSSSGILEVPCFGIPTVNIGDRQRGRIQAESIINCAPEKASIIHAIEQAMTAEFIGICSHTSNPYGDGNTSSAIVTELCRWLDSSRLRLKKKFYNLNFEV